MSESSHEIKAADAAEQTPVGAGDGGGTPSSGPGHQSPASPVARMAWGGLPQWATWVTLGAIGALLAMLYYPFVNACVAAWRKEESYYSHGFLIPLIAAWLLWARRKEIAAVAPAPSNWGIALVAASVALHVFANYIYLQTGAGLAMVLMLMGVILHFRGWAALRLMAFPIAFLLFAVPLSPIFTEPVSFPMRLMSTKLAVSYLHAVGVEARASGTLIQFPTFTLVVPNACSGMQSLLALFAALVMFVYIVAGPWWKKLVLLLAIPPLVIAANGARLALTGLAASGLTQAAARGTVHEMTGILVFIIACMGLLLLARVVLGLDTLAIGGDDGHGEQDA